MDYRFKARLIVSGSGYDLVNCRPGMSHLAEWPLLRSISWGRLLKRLSPLLHSCSVFFGRGCDPGATTFRRHYSLCSGHGWRSPNRHVFIANGLLSAISDNLFVATIYIEQVLRAFHQGMITRDHFDLLALAINTGTNIPSGFTPNGR